MDFGATLRKLREAKGYTRRQLAEAVGLSEFAIRSYENGERLPSRDSLKKLADFLGVSAEYLLKTGQVRSHDQLKNLERKMADRNRELTRVLQELQRNPLDTELAGRSRQLLQEIEEIDKEIQVLALNLQDIKSVPIISSTVPGGPLLPVEPWRQWDDVIGYVHTTNKRVTYAIRLSGDSLQDKGITDGSILLVEPTQTASPGELVIATDGDSCTAKFLVRKEDGNFYLRAANKNYPDIPFDQENMRIIGVVRDYRPSLPPRLS